MVYGYARVSTKGQARDGNSLESQQNELMAAGSEKYIVMHLLEQKLIALSWIN